MARLRYSDQISVVVCLYHSENVRFKKGNNELANTFGYKKALSPIFNLAKILISVNMINTKILSDEIEFFFSNCIKPYL